MTYSELIIRELLDCLCKNVIEVISTSQAEFQNHLADDPRSVLPADREDRPTSKVLEKLWLSAPAPLASENNCRSCAFWMDPGQLATYGLCCRLVLAFSDLLTRNEDMIQIEPYSPLYTPENFLCAHFTARLPEGYAGSDPAKCCEQVLNQAVEELFDPFDEEVEMPVPSSTIGDGNVR